MNKVMEFDYAAIAAEQDRLNLLRALTLALTRGGKPEPEIRLRVLRWLDDIYPAASARENRDLTALLASLESPSLVPRAMMLLETSTSQEEQITYAMNLRFIKEGWNCLLYTSDAADE